MAAASAVAAYAPWNLATVALNSRVLGVLRCLWLYMHFGLFLQTFMRPRVLHVLARAEAGGVVVALVALAHGAQARDERRVEDAVVEVDVDRARHAGVCVDEVDLDVEQLGPGGPGGFVGHSET